MEGSKVTAIVFGSILLLVIIAGIVLYFLFCYKKWKISTKSQRKQYKLNNVFTHIEACCSSRTSIREDSTTGSNLPQITTAQHTEHSHNTDGIMSSGIAYDNKKLCVAVIGVNMSDVDLQISQSPIRKSAETYSVVDLHGDT